jgi:DNA-directed RNA polymerase
LQVLLGELLVALREQHPHIAFPRIPDVGSFDIEQVARARYFFN